MKRLAAASRTAVVALVTTVLLLSTVAPALADPIADKKAEAARVQQQVDTLNTKAEIAAENFNDARGTYNRATDRVHGKEREIATLKKRTKRLQRELDRRASLMYRQGPIGALMFLLDARTLDSFVSALNALNQASRRDAATIAQLKESKRRAVAARAELVQARAAAAKQKALMAANERDVKAQLGESTRLLSSVNADVRRLIAEEKAREEAAARARAAALRARQRAAERAARRGRSSGGYKRFRGGNPPASGKGAKAVWWAEQALGKPYRWAASGPNAFDCSGLVMWAYRHVGVRLPHSSRAQINRGRRVSRENLQPGDLVFFGSPIHHVGMYVGGGDFIEAPYTGARVRITSLGRRGDYAGACRP